MKKELDKILHKTAEYMSDGRKRPNFFLLFLCGIIAPGPLTLACHAGLKSRQNSMATIKNAL